MFKLLYNCFMLKHFSDLFFQLNDIYIVVFQGYRIVYTETIVKKISFKEPASIRYDQGFIQAFWQNSDFVLTFEFRWLKLTDNCARAHWYWSWGSRGGGGYGSKPSLWGPLTKPLETFVILKPLLWSWSPWCQHRKNFRCTSKLLHKSNNLHKDKEQLFT